MRAELTADKLRRFLEALGLRTRGLRRSIVLSRDLERLPGADLVGRGLDDLARGAPTREALLVAAAATRLRDAGLPVPPPERLPAEPELQLYRLLRKERPRDAHAFYNALLDQVISFAFALERDRRRTGP